MNTVLSRRSSCLINGHIKKTKKAWTQLYLCLLCRGVAPLSLYIVHGEAAEPVSAAVLSAALDLSAHFPDGNTKLLVSSPNSRAIKTSPFCCQDPRLQASHTANVWLEL